jgi:hypothetical protein
MLSLKDRTEAVKAEIPKALYLAIVRLQASEGLDWEEACVKASELLDANGQAFKRAVKREAQRLYNKRFMEQLNKAQGKIREGAFMGGIRWARENEDNFRVPCSICGEPMHFSSSDKNWESEVKPTLYGAFKNWCHAKCPTK